MVSKKNKTSAINRTVLCDILFSMIRGADGWEKYRCRTNDKNTILHQIIRVSV